MVSGMEKSTLRVSRPRRWDQPFGEELLPETLVNWALTDSVLTLALSDYLQGNTSIEEILRNDARKVDIDAGEILIRKGDYGGSVFLCMSGKLRVLLDPAGEQTLDTREKLNKKSWFEAISQLWQNSRMPETRADLSFSEAQQSQDSIVKKTRMLPMALPEFLTDFNSREIYPGELTGEIAALRRSSRTATIFAEEPSSLIEIRWQGLRDICRRSKSLWEFLEERIRTYSLQLIFSDLPLLESIPEQSKKSLVQEIRFERHGDENWNRDLRSSMGNRQEILSRETLVVKSGQHLDGVFILMNGFARISKDSSGTIETRDYLRPGDVFGIDEVLSSIEEGVPRNSSSSLRCIGATDLLLISTPSFKKHIYPYINKQDLLDNFSRSRVAGKITGGMLDFLLDHRTINGNQTMIIDLNRCTDCDDCVKACAVTHDGNPRFIREGHRHAQLMVATACMHCCDPVCLIGCPTGAIHRDPHSGNVIIQESTCIGCGTCVDACPYDSIRTVEIRDPSGNPIIDIESGEPLLRATKCDLCIDQPSGPACVNACPHDALHRIDFGIRDPLMSRRG